MTEQSLGDGAQVRLIVGQVVEAMDALKQPGKECPSRDEVKDIVNSATANESLRTRNWILAACLANFIPAAIFGAMYFSRIERMDSTLAAHSASLVDRARFISEADLRISAIENQLEKTDSYERPNAMPQYR